MQLGSGWKFNFRAFYGSGFAYTPLVPDLTPMPIAGLGQEEGDINSEHLPPYKRLDVRLSRVRNGQRPNGGVSGCQPMC
ncbi:MAG: hypothetical protein R3C26_24185 [Calditrichia bacterium]